MQTRPPVTGSLQSDLSSSISVWKQAALCNCAHRMDLSCDTECTSVSCKVDLSGLTPKKESTDHSLHAPVDQREDRPMPRLKKRQYGNFTLQMEPSAVARRNERERNRVRLVNDGFSCLRKRIPYFPDKKKLSKVETLRCAVAYIKHLQDLINEHDATSTDNAVDGER